MDRITKLKQMLCNYCNPKSSQLENLQQTKRILSNDMYQISPINKSVSRDILSLAYTPGVGEVCLQIKDHPELVDKYTLRARSVAIVSDGSMLGSEGRRFMPAMDWFVVQLKYYANIDAFPFVIRQQTNLKQLFHDLSTTYGTVLYLDNKELPKVPENMLIIKQQQIAKLYETEVTDMYRTAKIIGYLIKNKVKGVASYSKQQYDKYINSFQVPNFIAYPPFDHKLHDNKTLKQHSLYFHQFYNGKILIQLNFRDINYIKPFFSYQSLLKITQQQNPYSKTRNISAIVTDGTAILGLGNIGPVAGLPVMEGKSLLFKTLGDVDIVPFCMYPRKSAQELIKAIDNSVGYFRAINLQDIKAPQCFQVQKTLKKMKNIPIFHDDQHGTAIVVLGGLITAMKLAGKQFNSSRFIINGAGAAGDTIARLIIKYGAKPQNLILCDTKGAIFKGRKVGMNSQKQDLAQKTNLNRQQGGLQKIIKNSDVFVGVSVGNVLKKQWVKTMNQKPIIFALANPNPQIYPQDAKLGGAFIYASGRSDFQNQINNSLVFPGIFKGILKHNLDQITDDMKLLAAEAISKSLVKQPNPEYIIPDSLDRDVTIKIAEMLGKYEKKL